jgi:hypothetical protein
MVKRRTSGTRGWFALVDAVFGFMEELMSQCPAVFVEAAHRALRKQHTIECARAVGILGRPFESARADFQGLLQKFLIQAVIGALRFCNETVPPDPLTAVRRIADTDQGVLQHDMQTIWQAVVSSLQLEPRGQQFHRQTVAAAALLFGIARRNGIDSQLFPEMLCVLPPEHDALYIYEKLVAILRANGDAVAAAVGPDLMSALTRTFALKESDLTDLTIPPDVASVLLELLRQLMLQPGAHEIIHACLTDETAQARLAGRLTSQ